MKRNRREGEKSENVIMKGVEIKDSWIKGAIEEI